VILRERVLVAAVTLLALGGCTPVSGGLMPSTGSSGAATGLPVQDNHWPMPRVGSCHYRGIASVPLPDPACTPGAVNPQVSQATIRSTICVKGWTATVRPAQSVTSRMKKASARSYSFTGTGEYDHLIPLELGGATADPRNLWVEPGRIPNPKDKVEGSLNHAVCAGRLSLVAAQLEIAHDWTTAR